MRFWIYWNGWVKVVLRPTESITLERGGSTDEGYHYEQWRYIHCGTFVRREISTNSRDCDGPLDRYAEYTADIENLSEESPPYEFDWNVRLPGWDKERSSQRDYYAERMGY